MFERISRTVAEQARRLAETRSRFRIAVGQNGYPERAISYFYIRAIVDAVHQGTAVIEVPIPSDTTKRTDNHLDTLVFDDDVAILAEFKRA